MKLIAKKYIVFVIIPAIILLFYSSRIFAQESQNPKITLNPLQSVCFEPKSSIMLDGNYLQGTFSDFAIYYTNLPEANAPTLATLIAHPVPKLPFEFIVPQDFPRSATTRLWVAGHNEKHERVALAKTRFFEIAENCRPIAIFGLAPTIVNQSEAVIRWSTNYPADGFIEYGTTEEITQKSEIIPTTNEETDYELRLTKLTPNTPYYFRVTASRNANIVTRSNTLTFRTLPENADNTANSPKSVVIENVSLKHISTSSVEISWNTDVVADSEAEYGLTVAFDFNKKTLSRPQLTALHLPNFYQTEFITIA